MRAAWGSSRSTPGITHAYENTGSDTMVLVAFSSHPHDPADPDTFREVLVG